MLRGFEGIKSPRKIDSKVCRAMTPTVLVDDGVTVMLSLNNIDLMDQYLRQTRVRTRRSFTASVVVNSRVAVIVDNISLGETHYLLVIQSKDIFVAVYES